jgi:LysM repeat protein
MNRQFEDNAMLHRRGWSRKRGWQLGLLVAVFLCAGLWLATFNAVHAQEGYNYTVQQGDSWATVARRTGVSVEALKEANPDAVRENDWLLVGETLLVPSRLSSSPTYHVVTAGESWNSIAEDYGVPVDLLRAANPGAIRTGNILYRGERLVIPPVGASVRVPTPTSSAATEETDVTPEADTTEEAGTTAEPVEDAGVTAEAEATEEATATATETVEEVTEEATEETTAEPVEPTATPMPTAEIEAVETMTATVEATSEVTATTDVTDTEVLTETDMLTLTEELTDSAELTTTLPITDETTGEGVTGVDFDLPACPERFADYAEVMTELINSADPGPEAVVAFLDACEALVDDGAEMIDLTGDGIDELIVVYQNPSAEQIFVEGDLVIFNSGLDEYTLGYRARAAGEVRLLTVDDINLDEKPDVAWVDTTCGASTCFDTVNVRSWDGSTWADWTEGTITMAYAEITLTDQVEEGLGEEVVLEGGIYGSVGAGPQRSRTEVWASMEGAPYSLLEKSYDQNECLYHTVLDANRAFLEAPVNGFEAATALYTQAVTDTALTKCWVRNDELAELRSFSQFRLGVIAGYTGDSAGAEAAIAELSEQYPGSIYDEVGQVWLTSYEATGDAAIACQEVTAYAEENSEAWEMLADYGYTNPSFEAVDVCPVLDLSASATEGAEATPEGTPEAGQ